MVSTSPLDANHISVELALNIIKIREDKGLVWVKAACNDVLDIFLAQPVSLLQFQGSAHPFKYFMPCQVLASASR